MKTTPRGNRLHIGFFGRRNAGKSSLFNALAGHDLSIVSPEPGTTTDPVNKGMELQPLGPVMLVDTAGLDDVGLLGDQRKLKTRRAIDRIDIGVIVVGKEGWGAFEADILAEFQRREKRIIIALSHARERVSGEKAGLQQLSVPVVLTDAPDGYGLDALRKALVAVAPEESAGGGPLISDLVGPGECALLVIPIDSEAPKGRIILPQVQVMRELLDNGALGLITREHELERALDTLGSPPKLVVTDSQAFGQVSAIVPEDIALTSFSILFARAKGDLVVQSRGAAHISALQPGATVLVAEACTHHPTGEDIGRHKLPAWLKKQVGGDLEFVVRAGRTFPEDLSPFDLVVHCGACMWNRSEMNARLQFAAEAGVAITNYGLAIAHCHGIMDRALRPFPDALAAYRQTAALEVE